MGRTSTRPALLATVALAGVLLVACGDSGSDGTGDGLSTGTPVAVSDDLVQVVSTAPAGSTFVLAAGDHVVTTTLVVDGDVTLTGADRDQVRIVKRDGITSQQTGSAGSPVVAVDGGTFAASGITFAYEGAGEAHVVVATATDANVDIAASAFIGGVRAGSEVGSGLLLAGSTTGTVTDSLFFDNDQDGLEYRDAADVTVTGSDAYQNAYSGIAVKHEAAATLTDTDARDNGGHGVVVWDDASLELTGGAVNGNGSTGIKFYLRSTGTVADAGVQNNAGKGIWVTDDAVATLTGSTLTGNDDDGIAFGFQTSGTANGNTIGLNGENALGIRVNDSSTASAIENDIDGTGEMGIVFQGQADGVARGNLIRNTGSHGILVADQANALLEDNETSDNAGYGLAFEGSATATATGNLTTGNFRGVRVVGSAAPTLRTNTIRGNGVGVEFLDTAAGTLDDNRIEQNDRDGVAIGGSAVPDVTANAIDDNGWCGVRLEDDSDPTLSGNAFSGNVEGEVCDQRGLVPGVASLDGQVAPYALGPGTLIDPDEAGYATGTIDADGVFDIDLYDPTDQPTVGSLGNLLDRVDAACEPTEAVNVDEPVWQIPYWLVVPDDGADLVGLAWGDTLPFSTPVEDGTVNTVLYAETASTLRFEGCAFADDDPDAPGTISSDLVLNPGWNAVRLIFAGTAQTATMGFDVGVGWQLFEPPTVVVTP